MPAVTNAGRVPFGLPASSPPRDRAALRRDLPKSRMSRPPAALVVWLKLVVDCRTQESGTLIKAGKPDHVFLQLDRVEAILWQAVRSAAAHEDIGALGTVTSALQTPALRPARQRETLGCGEAKSDRSDLGRRAYVGIGSLSSGGTGDRQSRPQRTSAISPARAGTSYRRSLRKTRISLPPACRFTRMSPERGVFHLQLHGLLLVAARAGVAGGGTMGWRKPR